MNSSNRLKLFVMMVLQFFIWGAWLPLIFGYLPSLGFSASNPPASIAPFFPENAGWTFIFSEQSLILNAFPVAAIVGMFFSNQFADRSFSAEKFLAFSHLVGGLAMLGLAFTKDFWPFFLLMLVHCLLYVPTISITNSIAFANMKDPKEFGIVRMGGTIGWILAAWPFTFILVDWAKVSAANPQGVVEWFEVALGSGLTGQALQDGTRWTYIVAGIASLVLAAYSLALPHTPPKKVEEGASEALAWLQAMKLLKHPFVLVLWLVTFVDAFVHNSYFNWTGVFLGTTTEAGGVGVPGNWIMPIMSVGQIAEILTMAVLGVTLKNLGWRATMVLGILGHAARFAVYAYFPQSQGLIIVVQVLHGICYAFFFATVYIFVDEYFPKDARASAQGLFNLMILGIGALAANSICPKLLQEVYTTTLEDGTKATDFHGLFLVPLFCAVGAALALALFFHPPKKEEAPAAAVLAPSH
jgi:MFS family permease